jgi:hypothetical protein
MVATLMACHDIAKVGKEKSSLISSINWVPLYINPIPHPLTSHKNYWT